MLVTPNGGTSQPAQAMRAEVAITFEFWQPAWWSWDCGTSCPSCRGSGCPGLNSLAALAYWPRIFGRSSRSRFDLPGRVRMVSILRNSANARPKCGRRRGTMPSRRPQRRGRRPGFCWRTLPPGQQRGQANSTNPTEGRLIHCPAPRRLMSAWQRGQRGTGRSARCRWQPGRAPGRAFDVERGCEVVPARRVSPR